jgi:hypothetical protein
MAFRIKEEVHGRLAGDFLFKTREQASRFVAKRASDILFNDSEARLIKAEDGNLTVTDPSGRIIYEYKLYEQ